MGKIYDQLWISLLGNSSSWYLYRDWNFEHCNDRTSQVRLYLWMVIVLLILSKYIDWEPRIYKMCTCWVTLVVSKSLWPHGLQTARLLCPWGFPGKNTGVGCHFLLQGNLLTQGLNLHLLCFLHGQVILCHWATWEAHWRTIYLFLMRKVRMIF